MEEEEGSISIFFLILPLLSPFLILDSVIMLGRKGMTSSSRVSLLSPL
jgi:arginine exporter protein ArgO